MHPYVSTKTRRHRRAPVLPGTLCLMSLTVAAGLITALRQVVMWVCGDALQFIRIEACAHSQQMRVCVCVTKAMAGPAEEAIHRYLPDTQFGAVDAKLVHLVHLARPALQ